MPNFDTCLHPRVEIGMQMWHLPPLHRFTPSFALFCIKFALSNFAANPFFRPVAATIVKSVERPHVKQHQNCIFL